MVSQEAINKLEENSNDSIDKNNPKVKSKIKLMLNLIQTISKTWGKVGRNEKCPCGSGKKV